jgi:DnaJ-domain-containing protein 1
MMACDLGFSGNTNCYGALDSIPRTMDTRGALDLDDVLDQVADASMPRAPVDLPFTCDDMKPPQAYGGAVWSYPNKEEAEQVERVWVDDYDSDATLAIEGDYAFATEAEQKAQRQLLRVPGAPIESDEEEEAMMEVEEKKAAPAAAVSVRVCFEWQPKMKTWAGAVPACKPNANKKNAKARLPKKLRVALPVGVLDNDEEATLAHGMLVKGMAGGMREERIALLKAAGQLGRATRRLGKAIGDEINAHIPVGEPLLSFGRGADDARP